ncbi:MOSC domain-containing protein [Amycolatopsis antarctica]|uniref:MOSC domain-containing protein n=1 Tax=Amycolatopsis antarctica TaxID=1854586 RepID=A0A263D809_9PSEU|nr:MOSC domain-containing protein [Amycolatopsis antarctica]OZM74521.1 MOSC domain-containing protein [Amycolatopsis antarctica]
MGTIESVNVGTATPSEHTGPGITGIAKRPVPGRIAVTAPGPRGSGGSGLAGDAVCDLRFHGGDDKAVYAYAAEDLRYWAGELDPPPGPGTFGENLTTAGLDLTGALIGQRWQVGGELVLEVSGPRIPCRTFAAAIGVPRWVRTFMAARRPGTYLRVITPGTVAAGDPVRSVHTPDHEVTITLAFRALTTERSLLPRLLPAGIALPTELRTPASTANW